MNGSLLCECPVNHVFNPKTKRCVKQKYHPNLKNTECKCPPGMVWNSRSHNCNKPESRKAYRRKTKRQTAPKPKPKSKTKTKSKSMSKSKSKEKPPQKKRIQPTKITGPVQAQPIFQQARPKTKSQSKYNECVAQCRQKYKPTVSPVAGPVLSGLPPPPGDVIYNMLSERDIKLAVSTVNLQLDQLANDTPLTPAEESLIRYVLQTKSFPTVESRQKIFQAQEVLESKLKMFGTRKSPAAERRYQWKKWKKK